MWADIRRAVENKNSKADFFLRFEHIQFKKIFSAMFSCSSSVVSWGGVWLSSIWVLDMQEMTSSDFVVLVTWHWLCWQAKTWSQRPTSQWGFFCFKQRTLSKGRYFQSFHEDSIYIITRCISFRLHAVRAKTHPLSFYLCLSLWMIRMHPHCLSAFSLITQRETWMNAKYTVCPHLSTPYKVR